MIKGKKIGEINLKVSAPVKSMQKAVGVPLGKFYMPEKTKVIHHKQPDQYQNQEDQDTFEEKYKNDCKQQQIIEKTTSIKSIEAKQKEKINTGIQIDNNKDNKKIKEQAKKGLEKYNNPKENRNLINAFKKQLKTNKNIEPKRNPQQKNQQLSKTSKVNNSCKAKETTATSTKIRISEKQSDEVRQAINNEVESKVKTIEERQVEEQEDQIDQEEVEQQRVFLPHPYAQQLKIKKAQLLISEEISFQNDAFQLPIEKEPIQYQSSEEEDSNQDEYYRITRKDVIETVDVPEEISSLQQLSLNIKSELFSLSAQELLAKEYFNVWQCEL